MIPSNSLAAVYGIALDCAERRVLGPRYCHRYRGDRRDQYTRRRAGAPRSLPEPTAISVLSASSAFSRTSTRVPSISRPRFARRGSPSPWADFTFRGACRCWTGALSIWTRAGRWASPCLPAKPRAGFELVLRDAAAGKLSPVYNFMKDLPPLQGTPVPFLPKQFVSRTLELSASFDAGRGCPYQCSFCTIINVQGRASRSSFGRRHRTSAAPQLGARHPQVLHHRR